MEFGISESYANKLYHQILDVLVKVLSLKNRKHLLEGDLQTIIIDGAKNLPAPPKGSVHDYTILKEIVWQFLPKLRSWLTVVIRG